MKMKMNTKLTPEDRGRTLTARAMKQHAEKFPHGCGGFYFTAPERLSPSWTTMCDDCRARLGALEPPSAGITEWRRLEALTFRLDSNLSSGRKALERFRKDLDENPAYALRWSDAAFQAAAEIEVATKMKDILAHPEGGRVKALEHAREQALRGARCPERSTSGASNMMAQALTQAWAELVSDALGRAE